MRSSKKNKLNQTSKLNYIKTQCINVEKIYKRSKASICYEGQSGILYLFLEHRCPPTVSKCWQMLHFHAISKLISTTNMRTNLYAKPMLQKMSMAQQKSKISLYYQLKFSSIILLAKKALFQSSWWKFSYNTNKPTDVRKSNTA